LHKSIIANEQAIGNDHLGFRARNLIRDYMWA